MPRRNSPIAFSLLIKPAGAACNLACEYCFYREKESLYPDSKLRMPDNVLRSTLKQLLASQPGMGVSVAWQGGEPTLMGLDFFKRSVELVKRYRKPGQPVSYSLQTNGTLLDDEWCHFFKENDFLIGLSLDGPDEMYNAYRVDKGGKGSFQKALLGWELLQKHKVDTNILCAVQAGNGSHPLEVYRFFRDGLGAQFIQFIPIVEFIKPKTPQINEGADGANMKRVKNQTTRRGEGEVTARSVKARQWGKFLVKVFDEWVRRDVGTVFVQTFDSALASWCGLPAGVCVFQETCGTALVMEHNGDVYACDHFVEPGHLLGNIMERPLVTMVTSPQQRQFGLDKAGLLPSTCRDCEVLFACQGECPRNRVRGAGGTIEDGQNALCEGYRMFFEHVDRPMRRMGELLRRGRSAAEIMG